MSSVKKLNMCRSEKCNVGHGSTDDSHIARKRRNMPPILRLDSTGEATSHDFGGIKSRGCDRKCRLANTMNKSFQNIVNYVGAASSSFLDLSSGISSHLTADRGSPFDCVKKILQTNQNPSDRNQCDQHMADTAGNETQPPFWGSPIVDTGHDNDTYPYLKRHLTSWPKSVIGAVGKNAYNKASWHSFHRHTCNNGYSPYYRQGDILQTKRRQTESFSNCDNNLSIDPHLKPYNARLLLKSKQFKKSIPTDQQSSKPKECDLKQNIRNTESDTLCSVTNTCKSDTDRSVYSSKQGNGQKGESSGLVDIKGQSVPVICLETVDASPKDSIEKSSKPVQVSGCNVTDRLKKSNADNGSNEKIDNEKVTDWFEYESKDLKTIPVNLHAFEQKCKITDTSPDTDSAFVYPSLHSWFSIDLDADTMKCKTENVVKNDPQVSKHQNDETVKEPSKVNTCINNSQTTEKPCDIKKINVKIENIDLSPNLKSENTNDMKPSGECDKSFVLYVRNLSSSKKASKPSCKKRRRKRAKKEGNIDEKPAEKPKNISEELDNKCKESPLAFILGIDADSYSSGKAHPFLVSCDMNSDSDWSDSEECEESPEEPVPDELSMFTLCDNFNPLNFQVVCSVQSSPTESSSHIDAVNLSWQVNVCVSPATQNKSQSDKKVHFANEKDLVVEHPVCQMAEWCEAYEEARKGPWVQFALDRERFRKRITDSESVLNPILLDGHRQKVFNERFAEH